MARPVSGDCFFGNSRIVLFNMQNKKEISGRCHCHKISFTIEIPTEFCSHCHCESCRRIHGAAFVTWTSVPDEQLQIRGDSFLKEYESSPGVIWTRCDSCGSPLFQTTRHSPGRTYVAVSSLIEPLDRAPESHVSIEEKVQWVSVNDGLPQHRAKASDRLDENGTAP